MEALVCMLNTDLQPRAILTDATTSRLQKVSEGLESQSKQAMLLL